MENKFTPKLIALAVGSVLSAGASAEIVISQYVEGYGYNKAIQIKNVGTESVDLAPYELIQYTDGSDPAKVSSLVNLSGDLAAGGTLVVANSDSRVSIQEIKDAPVKASTYFNGNDSVALRKDGQLVDVVGTLDTKPLDANFKDTVLARKADYTAANPSGFAVADTGLWDKSECKASDNCTIAGLTTNGYTPYQAPAVTMAQLNGDLTTLTDSDYLTDYVGKEIKVKGIVTYNDTYKKIAFVQAADDGNVNTPDAIRVQGSKLNASVGDTVWVTGTVGIDKSLQENYHPLPYIELKSVSPAEAGDVIQEADLAVVTFKGNEMPNQFYDSDPSTFDPAKDGNDFLRRYAGMKVTIEDAVAVTGVNKYGNVWVVANKGQYATGMTGPRGGMVVSPINGTEETATQWDYNPEVLKVIEKYRKVRPGFQAGTEVGNVTGFLGWDYGEYTLFSADYMEPGVSGAKQWDRQVIDLVGDKDHLTVSNFNVENLVFDDSQEKFDGLAKLIVENLKSPDIIALQEVGDDSGDTKNDGVVESDKTLKKLIDAIHNLDAGLKYKATYISPQEGMDGGKPGLNIRVAYLYNTTRVGFMKSKTDAGATDSASVLANGKLSFNPVRVNVDYTYDDQGVTKKAFENTRKTLAAQFMFNGNRITLLNNHWSSKRGETPVNGKLEYTAYPRRNAQAQATRELIDQLLANDANAKVIALGDMNEFYYNEPLKKYLSGKAGGKEDMHNLTHALPLKERYSYVFGGNTQELDHLFVSDALYKDAVAKPVHVNAEYSDQLSDHDPMVAKLLVEKKKRFSVKHGKAGAKAEVTLPLSAQAVAGDKVRLNLKKKALVAKTSGDISTISSADNNVIEHVVTDENIEARSVSLELPTTVSKGEYDLSASLYGSDELLKESIVENASLTVEQVAAEETEDSSGGSFGFGALLAMFGLGWMRRRRA